MGASECVRVRVRVRVRVSGKGSEQGTERGRESERCDWGQIDCSKMMAMQRKDGIVVGQGNLERRLGWDFTLQRIDGCGARHKGMWWELTEP